MGNRCRVWKKDRGLKVSKNHGENAGSKVQSPIFWKRGSPLKITQNKRKSRFIDLFYKNVRFLWVPIWFVLQKKNVSFEFLFDKGRSWRCGGFWSVECDQVTRGTSPASDESDQVTRGTSPASDESDQVTRGTSPASDQRNFRWGKLKVWLLIGWSTAINHKRNTYQVTRGTSWLLIGWSTAIKWPEELPVGKTAERERDLYLDTNSVAAEGFLLEEFLFNNMSVPFDNTSVPFWWVPLW